MTERSQNGWTASQSTPTRTFSINGVSYVGGIRDDDDVYLVMQYVMQQVANRVEKPVNPGCWGRAYRANRNDPNSLSNHSSATALDHNAPRHPNGVVTSRTFNKAQIAEVHQILSEVNFAIRWGGDYSGTPDSMHFEVNVTPERLAVVAKMIRAKQVKTKPTPLPRKVRIWLGNPRNVRRLKRQIEKAKATGTKVQAIRK